MSASCIRRKFVVNEINQNKKTMIYEATFKIGDKTILSYNVGQNETF